MTRQIDNTRLDTFMAHYEPHLTAVVQERPEEYCYPVSTVPQVAQRMRAAFERGSYNHDGLAIARTCRALGLKHTRKAIEAFLSGVEAAQ